MDSIYLFRGKRIENGEWVCGAFCPKDSYKKGLLFPDKHAHACIIPLEGADEGYWIRVHPATVGQCTGLTAAKSYRGDRPEDLLIFEGDILDLLNGIAGVVNWGHCAWMLNVGDTNHMLSSWAVSVMEIIGTVHDPNRQPEQAEEGG